MGRRRAEREREWSKDAKEIQAQLMLRASLAGSHQSNGMVENTVRRVDGIVHTLKAALERRLKATIVPRQPILP